MFALVVGFGLAIIATAFCLICDWILHKQMVSGGAAGRYVFITGCDSGFGKRAAHRLDMAGCQVIATCLTPDGAGSLRDICSSHLTTVQMDVTDELSVQQAFTIVSELLQPDKGLWGIVNNVGVPGVLGPLEWFSQSDITQLFEVNVFGTCRVTRTFLPLLKRGGGRVVNMSSILGRLNIPFAAPYCMTKGAVESFSDALRVELHPYNIHVSIIEPGIHRTNFLDSIKNYVTAAWDQLPSNTKDEFGMEYLQKVMFLGTKLIPFFGSTNIDGVVDAYCHALFAVRPRRRYVVGLDAKLLQLVSLLPSFVLDLMFLSPILRAVPASCRQ